MATLAGLQDQLATGATSSVAVVDDLLARIDETESRLNAYVCVNHEGARGRAGA